MQLPLLDNALVLPQSDNDGVQPVPGDWVFAQNRLATGTRLQRMVLSFSKWGCPYVTVQTI